MQEIIESQELFNIAGLIPLRPLHLCVFDFEIIHFISKNIEIGEYLAMYPFFCHKKTFWL
jgi:hypothetical protein